MLAFKLFATNNIKSFPAIYVWIGAGLSVLELVLIIRYGCYLDKDNK